MTSEEAMVWISLVLNDTIPDDVQVFELHKDAQRFVISNSEERFQIPTITIYYYETRCRIGYDTKHKYLVIGEEIVRLRDGDKQ